MERITRSMLATNAAERMREEPGCATVSSVQVVGNSDDWRLKLVIHTAAIDRDINAGRIAVQRAMKERYELIDD